ncbi:response regulator [Gilliamella sp. WF3-4]|jgi:signal transduction histidine kinase|uniref:response regulator n=1 Tax=Gilliamella sp. WF3-4 TaxID=3120255 RepID=UPI00080EE2B4|nr:response regulator [Gilliamella apicola]OCG17054.1 hypothetical protein A9G47_10430 [Gilliamella apicola]
MKILIVEDDSLLQKGLYDGITSNGYVCEVAQNGNQAEQYIQFGQFSLIILDLGLPDCDGLELLMHWRKNGITTPVLILTARDTRLLTRNLVENSYQYSPNETKILVSCNKDKKDILITVQDQGNGIDESKSEKLTQTFFRMDRKHNGIGLGLSIVNRIAKLHQSLFTLKNRTDNAKGVIAEFRMTASLHQLNE